MNHLALPSCTNDADAEESAEAYVLKRLSVAEFESYEGHLLVCERCQAAVAEFDVFLSTARVVLAEDPAVERPRRRAAKPRAKSTTG